MTKEKYFVQVRGILEQANGADNEGSRRNATESQSL